MKRGFYIVICCGIAVVALGFLPHSVRQNIQAAAGELLAPFSSFWHGIREACSSVAFDRNYLLAQNRSLARELEETRYQLQRSKWAEEENRRMKALLRVPSRPPGELIAGRVVARDISGWWKKVRLDIGHNDGVDLDMPVINGDGLVGRTVAVSSTRCEVLLLLDPSCRVSASTRDGQAGGIVRGRDISLQGEPLCRLEYVALAAPLKPDDELVTSGLGGVFPPGIAVGRVKDIWTEPSGLYRGAAISPAVDFRSLDFLFVVASPSHENRKRSVLEEPR